MLYPITKGVSLSPPRRGRGRLGSGPGDAIKKKTAFKLKIQGMGNEMVKRSI